MKVLVTGGAGYIGSVVTHQLVDAGHRVAVLDDLSAGFAENIAAGAEFLQLPVDQVADVLTPDAGFEAVLHFAGKIQVAESVARPDLYWHTNVADDGPAAGNAGRRDAATDLLLDGLAERVGPGQSACRLRRRGTRCLPAEPHGGSPVASQSGGRAHAPAGHRSSRQASAGPIGRCGPRSRTCGARVR